MTSKKQSVIAAQPSGVLEQEVTTEEFPLTARTPAKQERKLKGTKKTQEGHRNAGAPTTPDFSYSMADRIMSGSGRRKTTKSQADVGAAAINALADTVDAIIMPGQAVTERFLDSRDADRNVPDQIPGASAQQMQHSEEMQHAKEHAHARQSDKADADAASSALQSGVQMSDPKPSKTVRKRRSPAAKPALVQTVAGLAQGPNVSEDVLQEDDKVTKRRRSRKQLQVEDATEQALAHPSPHPRALPSNPTANITDTAQSSDEPASPDAASSPAVKPKAGKRKQASGATSQASEGPASMVDADEPMPVVTPKRRHSSKRAKAAPAGEAEATPAEAVAAAVEAVTSDDDGNRKVKRQQVKASEVAVDTQVELLDAPVKGKRQNRKKKEVVAAEMEAEVASTAEGASVTVTKRKSRAKAESNVPVFEMPGREVLETALQSTPPPRPVPNLGYACLNMDLREQKPPIFTNRDMVQKTFKQKGLPYVSQLALENSRAMKALIQWNHEHGIRFFRMTSNMFPWCTFYNMEDLPDFPAIAEELAFAGKLARAYDQRLTFHPSHFVKVAAADAQPELLHRSLKELEVHSQVLDLMGFQPSHWNKINIHIGGVYGDKLSTLDRFAQNFERLSDNCKARLTLENDDWGCAFSVKDLLPLSQRCGIPIVFDFHHHKFCSGDWSEQEAFFAALETWPKGIRPAVHWSESQDDRRPSAHSDYIQGPMNLHGKEADVDVMIEAKCKERTLLKFRDETMAKVEPSAKLANQPL